jgi:ABC-2 type transport system ATP-binding protein
LRAPLIAARDLTKRFRQAIKQPGLMGALKHLWTQRYQEKLAVDHLNFTIAAGEAVAYVGPNGAGKSTTIKMLTGILEPTAGEVRVDGLVPHRQRIQNAKKIGVVFGQRTQLWWDLPVRESLSLLKDIYEIPDQRYRANLDQLIELLDLGSFLALPARKISLGQRMRADLAAALLHEPRILFLDEPTIGLDIAVKKRIREFIKMLNRTRGTTILLTTHDLDDIEDLCGRLVIIDHGRIVYDGELQTVKDTFARDRVIHLQVRHPTDSLDALVSRIPGATLEHASEQQVSIRFDRFKLSARDILGQLMPHTDIVDFRIDEPRIEDVIRRVYDGGLQLSALGAERP